VNELPRLDDVVAPGDRVLRLLRPSGRAAFRRRFEVHTHDPGHMPGSGPVIVCSNHVGLLDGPLLAAFSPRPVHALTKREMFEGRTGRGLRAVGQIPLNRTEVDPRAIKTCLRVLADGGVVAVYPEGTRGSGELHHFHGGAAYLALASGAPVVPLVMFGSRPEGGGVNAVPARGDRVDLVFGQAVTVARTGWPRTREQVRATAVLLHKEMLAHLEHARALTGRELPGPITDVSPDEVVQTRPVSLKENL
jgi:1-acyl-sn-glycerol-3-phosphate acyltransferase